MTSNDFQRGYRVVWAGRRWSRSCVDVVVKRAGRTLDDRRCDLARCGHALQMIIPAQ
ncbi:hypothetical protein BIFDEN_00212 [Bifidobacterium dentium ATCC 27678]|nr:hypothetical protein BIFDEN_00212 [Bifidobacterium dentium ATCC 27678]